MRIGIFILNLVIIEIIKFKIIFKILKTVHVSNALIMMYDGCKYIFCNNKIDDIIRNKDDYNILR